MYKNICLKKLIIFNAFVIIIFFIIFSFGDFFILYVDFYFLLFYFESKNGFFLKENSKYLMSRGIFQNKTSCVMKIKIKILKVYSKICNVILTQVLCLMLVKTQGLIYHKFGIGWVEKYKF